MIVAIPPTLAGRIDYEPILPFQRDQLTQRFGQGTLTKVAAVYDTPFWRDAGLTGTAVTTDGPVTATFDDSPQSGTPWRDLRVRRRRRRPPVQRDVSRPPASRPCSISSSTFFGSQARNPIDFFETSWSGEQWTRGCPVGIPGQGTLLAYGPQHSPARRAGSTGPAPRRPTYWNGYMDGAVRSGERAAAEALSEL